jgi:hypothetical protein
MGEVLSGSAEDELKNTANAMGPDYQQAAPSSCACASRTSVTAFVYDEISAVPNTNATAVDVSGKLRKIDALTHVSLVPPDRSPSTTRGRRSGGAAVHPEWHERTRGSHPR